MRTALRKNLTTTKSESESLTYQLPKFGLTPKEDGCESMNNNNREKFVWHLYALATFGFIMSLLLAVFGVAFLTKYSASIPPAKIGYLVQAKFVGTWVPDSLRIQHVATVKELTSACAQKIGPGEGSECLSEASVVALRIYEKPRYRFQMYQCTIRNTTGEYVGCVEWKPVSPKHLRIFDSLATIAKLHISQTGN